MATRYVVGDSVDLTNTFTVDGAATDPTTITLEVTDPSGTTDSYTHGGGTLTKDSTGVYSKTITVDERGTWLYKWTGTGTAADIEDGTFEVYPVAAVNDLDVLTFGEAKDALQQDRAGSTVNDDQVRQWITAVSRRIDELCGPVVVRTVTDETHNGGGSFIEPRNTPVSSVTSLIEYDGTSAATLTAESNSTKPTKGYLLDEDGGHYCVIWRRGSNADAAFPPGRRNVVLTYEAGRYADTEDVHERFKLAAGAALRRLWHREAGAWARPGNPFAPDESGNRAGFFRAVDPVIHELLPDDIDLVDVRAV